MKAEKTRRVVNFILLKTDILDGKPLSEIADINKELEELERLSEVGKALEFAKKEYNQTHISIGKNYGLDDEIGGIIHSTDDLLDWYRNEVSSDKK